VDGLRALTEQLSGHLSDWVKGLTLRALRAAVQKEAQEEEERESTTQTIFAGEEKADAFTQATRSPQFVVSVPQWFQKAHARWQYPSGHAPYTKEFQVAAVHIQKVREINIVPDLRRVLSRTIFCEIELANALLFSTDLARSKCNASGNACQIGRERTGDKRIDCTRGRGQRRSNSHSHNDARRTKGEDGTHESGKDLT
jgi:hypothetical protein